MSPLPSVLIFGFGAFGRLIASAVSPHLAVAVSDPDPAAQAQARLLGHAVVGPQQAGRFDVVVLAVPVPVLGECLHRLAPHLRAGQVVTDVCSVKQGPAGLMAQILPAGVQILASHPLFGPQSMPAGVAAGRVVLCPVRGTGWRRIAAFLRRALGLKIIITTPEEHDRQAALTQGLTHLLARAMAGFQPHPLIRTRSFDLLAEALEMVASDAPEVFDAVTCGNPHVSVIRDRFVQLLAQPALPDAGRRGGDIRA